MNQERLLKIILGSHISEKATTLADKHNQVVFKVLPGATKAEIKAAVESLFEVKVKEVRVINRKGKQKRFGNKLGRRNDTKFAYVSLKEGHDINFAAAE